jgi:DNA-binding NarL/FixJ family response regulator
MPGNANGKTKAPGRKRTVVILDDQPIIRERLAQIVEDAHLSVCGEADECHAATRTITTAQPGMVITSLSLRNCHGLDFIKDLHAQFPELPILVFSSQDESVYAERAIRAGARGFIRKQESTKELLHAIRTVAAGEIYLSERVTTAKVTRFFTGNSGQPTAPHERLSDRELQVLQLIGQGRSTRLIAAALRLDVKTVETYRARIKEKLKLDSATELVQHAQQWLEHGIASRTQ